MTTRISKSDFKSPCGGFRGLFATLAFFGLSIGALNAQVCSIGTNTYATLDDALAAITDNTHTTIKLLDNIDSEENLYIYDRKITFDLNGKDLILACYSMYLGGYSVVDYAGAGNFKCIANIQTTDSNSSFGVIAIENGSTLKLMSVEITMIGGTNNSVLGMNCNSASTVIVNGDFKVTYSGNTVYGIDVSGNSTVTVNGSVTAADYGINASGSGTGTATTVTVNGNVNTANGYGVKAYDNVAITIDGKINAPSYSYIRLNNNDYTAADGVIDPAKPNYLKYIDGSSIVWVGNKTTAVESITNYELRIYPNPVKDELKIENGELRIEKVEICDLSGKMVNCEWLNGKSVNVSNLPQGIYFVKLETDKGTVTRKFVKE